MEVSGSAFVQSFTIIAREGLEVVLLIGAMLAVLRQSGASDAARGLWWGTAAAIVMSVLTALSLDAVFRSAENVEVLEGFTMLVAAAVLFFVGHWLLAKADVARWQRYVKSQIRSAAGQGSIWALAAVAFVAVYREGVETVLFYRALLASASGPGAILVGFVVGLVALAVLCYAIYRFGIRIPLRPFFAVTSAFLLLLAFTFAGKGVHELQEGGVLSETRVEWLRIAPLGVYPTVETLAVQAVILLGIFVPLAVRRIWPRSVARAEQTAAPPTSTAIDSAGPPSPSPLPERAGSSAAT
jgi:high-affinity iron transporter